MKKQIEEHIYKELQKLSNIEGKVVPNNIEDEIFRIIKSRKFRRRSASHSLLISIKESIEYNVLNNKPINITFLQGSYKLWRLDESPEVDWAELFALLHYAAWVRPILSFYKPGVIFDFYLDDLIMERISNYRRDEIISYQDSFQEIMNFIMSFCPKNLRFKITTVSSRFKDENDFWDKLNVAVQKWEKPENIKLSKSTITMIDLNYRPSPFERLGIYWREEIIRIHDAHSSMTDRIKYREELGKILAMPHHFQGSNNRLFVGSTKDSIVKYWVGVGALKKIDERFVTTILSPNQLGNAKFSIQDVKIDGLSAKNFNFIRIIE